MGSVRRAVWGMCLVAATSAATPGFARDDDPDRQARRHELRQQLQAERERWRSDVRGPGASGMAPALRGVAPADRPDAGAGAARGYGGPPGYAPPGHETPRHGVQARDPSSGDAPHGGQGGAYGWGGGYRLSPEERRALRQELRQHRP